MSGDTNHTATRDRNNALRSADSPSDVVISRNTFINWDRVIGNWGQYILPDLGAYELGAPLPVYGPRSQIPYTRTVTPSPPILSNAIRITMASVTCAIRI